MTSIINNDNIIMVDCAVAQEENSAQPVPATQYNSGNHLCLIVHFYMYIIIDISLNLLPIVILCC